MEATTGTSALNPLGTARAKGLAILRLYANLLVVPPGPAHATLDTTWRAGRTADLALRIRRQNRLSFAAVEHFGQLIALSRADLISWSLPSLDSLGIIDYSVDAEGNPEMIEEQVGVAAPVLEQVAAVWEDLEPAARERCAVASADHAAYCPMTESEHCAALEAQGFPAHLHNQVFAALNAIGLLRREHSTALRENVVWAPYVWGTEALDVAKFMKRLPVNEREALASISRKAAERPGMSIEDLGAEQRLVDAARHAGLFDATRVVAGSDERAFAFSPGLEHGISGGLTDATHERKLFVAHILNGHRFGKPGTGRIDHPIALVNALINRKSVGPTTAARTEYRLLEGAGIVRAEDAGGGKAMLHLVKPDVAEESLELLRLALDEDPSQQADSVDGLWIPGSAVTPEQDRHKVSEPIGEQREIFQATIERLRDEIGQNARGENIHG
jgi:hypothetical protein